MKIACCLCGSYSHNRSACPLRKGLNVMDGYEMLMKQMNGHMESDAMYQALQEKLDALQKSNDLLSWEDTPSEKLAVSHAIADLRAKVSARWMRRYQDFVDTVQP